MHMFPGSAINLNLPQTLPLPTETTRNIINGKYRVYMNYCTVSYSGGSMVGLGTMATRAGLYGNELHQHAPLCCRSGSRVVQHAAETSFHG